MMQNLRRIIVSLRDDVETTNQQRGDPVASDDTSELPAKPTFSVTGVNWFKSIRINLTHHPAALSTANP
jgi:hypothetical protein